RGPHHHERTVCARDRAADQNQFFGLAHLHHPQVLHSYSLVTKMPRHSHILPNATRRGTIADGAISTVRFRTVRGTLPSHVVLLHNALKSFAFRAADDIDEIASLKLCDVQIHFAFRCIRFQTKFAHETLRFDVRFLKDADFGAVQSRFFLRTESDLDRGIAIPICGDSANEDVIPR